jgi:hypothetical protein
MAIAIVGNASGLSSAGCEISMCTQGLAQGELTLGEWYAGYDTKYPDFGFEAAIGSSQRVPQEPSK